MIIISDITIKIPYSTHFSIFKIKINFTLFLTNIYTLHAFFYTKNSDYFSDKKISKKLLLCVDYKI